MGSSSWRRVATARLPSLRRHVFLHTPGLRDLSARAGSLAKAPDCLREAGAQRSTVGGGPVSSEEGGAVSIDWRAVAELVSRGDEHPLFVLDRAGTVRTVNVAAQRLLGAPPEEIVGRSPFAAPGSSRPDRWIAEVFRGTLRRERLLLPASAGRTLFCECELQAVGSGRVSGAVVRVLEAQDRPERPRPDETEDFEYEVRTAAAEFGRMIRVSHAGSERFGASGPSRRCHEELFGRASPCTDCPVLRGRARPQPTAIRRAGGSREAYRIITARRIEAATATVSVRHVDGELLSLLVDARVARHAANADLSSREQDVLRYLLMGRQLGDVARILGISVRTVRFHQANLMRKLGVDSRVDLTRLLL